MKKISAAGVVKHLRQLFSNPNNIPKKINSDRGVGELVFFFFFQFTMRGARQVYGDTILWLNQIIVAINIDSASGRPNYGLPLSK